MHFSKKSCHLSSAGPDIAPYGSHCSASNRVILNSFIPNVKNKDSENIKTGSVNTVFLTYIKSKRRTFEGIPDILRIIYLISGIL